MTTESPEPTQGSSAQPHGTENLIDSHTPANVAAPPTAEADRAPYADSSEGAGRRIKIGSQRAPDVAVMARRQTKPVIVPPASPSPVPQATDPARPPAQPSAAATVESAAAPIPSPLPPAQVAAQTASEAPAHVPAPRANEGSATVESAPAQVPESGEPSRPERRRTIPRETVETRHIEPPNIRAELPPEWEREVEEALGGMSVDDLMSQSATATSTTSDLAPETNLPGRVVSMHRDNVFVDLGQRHQGVLSLRQFVQPPEVGALVPLQVIRFDAEEGLYQLSLPGAAIDVSNWADVQEGMVVQARVTGHNKGGLECEVNSLRGFIPASQVSLYRIEDLSTCVGESWPCVVTEANPEKRNLVLSRRAVLERESAEARKNLLSELEPGAVREGIVRRVQDFGAFVDLGGVDGLVHVSQLAWNRIKHPSEVVEVGQRVTVRVQKIDPDSGKISLSMKELADNPWNTVSERYGVKTSHTGKVSKIMDFGAFVELEPGVEGLIHISEFDHRRVFRVKDVVSEGDEVDVQVLSVDVPSRRIALSRKALLARAEPIKAPESEEPDDPPALPRKPPKVPLKGGRGQSSGGGQFGLKW